MSVEGSISGGNQISLLYVDDEQDLLHLVQLYLEKTGEFRVDIQNTVHSALLSLSQGSYDAVISDYYMPDMDGITFLKEIRNQFGNIPFILFTGRGREEVVIEAINNGADFYLQKGGEPKAQFAELTHKIRQAVERRKIERSFKNSEKRLSDIINFLPDATFAIDKSGHVIAWNKAIEEMTGIPAGKILGMGDYEYALPFYHHRRPLLIDLIDESNDSIARYYSHTYRTDDSITAETNLPHPKGNQTHVLAKVSRLFNQDGETVGAIESIRDITEFKKTEEERKKNEYRLLLAEEISHSGCFEYYPARDKFWGTQETLHLLGISGPAREFSFDEVKGFIEDFAPLQNSFLDFLQGSHNLDVTFTINPADGSPQRIVHSIARIEERDADGRPVHITGVVQDVTEQKKAETSLIKSEERLRLTLDATNDGIWDWNIPSGTAFFSPRWYTMLGYEPGKLPPTYTTWRSLVHPEDIQKTEQKIKNSFLNKETGYTAEFRMQRKQGGWAFIYARGKVVEWDKAGVPLRIVGTHTDISDLKRTEQELAQKNDELSASFEELASSEEELRFHYNALAQSEENLKQTTDYLENLITYANVPIIVWNPDYSITRINHAFEDLIGRKAGEVTGRSLEILFPPDRISDSMQLLETTRAGVRWETVELDIMHRDGTIRNVLWNSSTLYTQDGKDILATIAQGRDITLLKRLEKEHEISVAQIQKNLAQLAILNDGIRNPLTVILSIADMYDHAELGDAISEQAERIDEMVNQLDIRWLESEKILSMLRNNYQICASPAGQHKHMSADVDHPVQDKPGKRTELSTQKTKLRPEEVEAELYTILDSIDAVIYVSDLESYELLYLNRTGRTLFGDIAGKFCYEVIHDHPDEPCHFCANSILTDNAEPNGVHVSEQKNTRNGRWYECRDRAIRWTNGRLVHLHVATDITDRKAAEEEMRLLSTIADNAPASVTIHDFAGNFLYANEETFRLHGYTRDEFMALNLHELDIPECAEQIEKNMQQIRTYGIADFDAFHYRKDRSALPLHVNARIISWKGNDALLSIASDLTERKREEATLRRINDELLSLTEELHERDEELRGQMDEIYRAKEEWEQIFQAIGNPSLILDNQHRILHANNAVQEISGISYEALRNRYCWEIFHGPEATGPPKNCPYEKMMKTKTLETSEMEVEAFGQTCLVSCTPIMYESGSINQVIHIATDITDKKQTEESLYAAGQKIQLLTRLTRHDILNQLLILQSFQDLALEERDLDTIYSHINRANESGERIARIIEFTRMYENFSTISSTWQKVSQVIEEAITEISPGLATISHDIPDSCEILVDPGIRKVFSTLIENAIRHGEHVTTVRFSYQNTGDGITISCEDNGIGIVDERKESIFEHGVGNHTGIGLFIAKEILAINGLSIRECGCFGKNARFEITVPNNRWRIRA